MIWYASIGLMAGFIVLVFRYEGDFSVVTKEDSRAWLWSWLRRGVFAPVAVWVLMNAGTMPLMPSLTPGIVMLRGKGAYFQALVAQTSLALMVIVSAWGTLTFGWFLASLFKQAKNTEDLGIVTVIWSPMLLILLWLFGVTCGWCGITFALVLWIWPLTHYVLVNADLTQPVPMYSKAIGKLKLGKYREAEMAIISQLENCETDFDGWMMLADLYAHQFHDLAEAEKTICDLCDDPAMSPSQVSIAMHRLADWQLKLRRDPASARRILEELCRRMPGTHLAKMAQHRINQLPQSAKELDELEQPKKVAMPTVITDLKEATKFNLPESREDALKMANQLVETLKDDPNDVPAREKLARIFAERLGQIDLAVEQLDLLVGMPEQPMAKSAEWLALMAAWQIEHRGASEGVQKILERLIHEFPQTPQAFEAQRRLSIMRVKPRGMKVRVVENVDE